MDENTIFSPPPNINTQNQNPIVPPQPENLPTSPPPSIISKILKIILGVAVVLTIIFLIYNFVLPKFFPAKINKVTLTYWGLWEEASVFAPIIDGFEKEHPNIKINYSNQDIKEYRERLVTRSNNGNGPDVFRFHNTWVPQLTELLLPLPSNVITKEDFDKNYYPVAKKDLIKNGAIYGIPLHMDTLNLYINRNLFQASSLSAPTDWIQFGNYSRQLTVKDENNNIKTAGAAFGTYGNITHAPDIISMLFAQNGVNLDDISTNTQAVSDALSFYTSFALVPGNVWDNTLDSSIRAFASGSLAMYFGYSWDFFAIKSMNPDLSFDVFPVPSLPGRDVTVASYWAEGVLSRSTHQKEALLFIKYLTLKETEQRLFTEQSKKRNFGEPYARMELAESLKNSVAYPFVANAKLAISSYFVDGTYDNGLNSQMNNYLNIAIDSILEGTSPQSAAETLSQGATQVLRQYGQ
ncbi:MAG: extracellular solute-binding protein [Candidatus Levybacteria bacterium]|nr:extracellular solute-binding protein [Candidatus Levybacteria bacterium]